MTVLDVLSHVSHEELGDVPTMHLWRATEMDGFSRLSEMKKAFVALTGKHGEKKPYQSSGTEKLDSDAGPRRKVFQTW